MGVVGQKVIIQLKEKDEKEGSWWELLHITFQGKVTSMWKLSHESARERVKQRRKVDIQRPRKDSQFEAWRREYCSRTERETLAGRWKEHKTPRERAGSCFFSLTLPG